jgi:hypothetical protein
MAKNEFIALDLIYNSGSVEDKLYKYLSAVKFVTRGTQDESNYISGFRALYRTALTDIQSGRPAMLGRDARAVPIDFLILNEVAFCAFKIASVFRRPALARTAVDCLERTYFNKEKGLFNDEVAEIIAVAQGKTSGELKRLFNPFLEKTLFVFPELPYATKRLFVAGCRQILSAVMDSSSITTMEVSESLLKRTHWLSGPHRLGPVGRMALAWHARARHKLYGFRLHI